MWKEIKKNDRKEMDKKEVAASNRLVSGQRIAYMSEWSWDAIERSVLIIFTFLNSSSLRGVRIRNI